MTTASPSAKAKWSAKDEAPYALASAGISLLIWAGLTVLAAIVERALRWWPGESTPYFALALAQVAMFRTAASDRAFGWRPRGAATRALRVVAHIVAGNGMFALGCLLAIGCAPDAGPYMLAESWRNGILQGLMLAVVIGWGLLVLVARRRFVDGEPDTRAEPLVK